MILDATIEAVDQATLSAQLAVAEAEVLRTQTLYNESRLTYQRYKKLFPQGAISKGQLEQAEAAAKTNQQLVRAAQTNLKQAQESLDYTVIKAPYSGVVTERFVEVGETINPGDLLFSGMLLSKLRAVAEIPQHCARQP